MVKERLLLANFDKDYVKEFSKVIGNLKIEYKFSNLDFDSNYSPTLILFKASSDIESFNRNLKDLKNQFLNIPIIAVIEAGAFDILLSAYYANIEHVIVAPLEQVDIEQAITKVTLIARQDINENIPVKQLLQLFSSPIKISDDSTLFKYLKEYFFQFDQVIELGLYIQDTDISFIEGDDLLKRLPLEKELSELKLVSNGVGKFFFKEINHTNVVMIPLYRDDKVCSWAIVSLYSSDYKEIINDYLINFILGIFHYRRNKEKALNLKELSNTDEVTGLYNQRKLFSDLEDLTHSYEKNKKVFSLLFIDIDHFKNVNDNFGHLVGSQILTQLGDVLKKMLRNTDFVYRYGGDEFVVLLPDLDQNQVHDIAIRILKTIKKHNFIISKQQSYNLSVSIGICQFPKDAKTSQEVIQFADKMMYQSKACGRGKVFHLKEVESNIFESSQI